MKHFNLLIPLLLLFIGTSCATENQLSSNEVYINSDWSIISSRNLSEKGDVLSSPGVDLSKWVKTQIPSTVLASLVASGEYKDIYLNKNFDDIPEKRFKKSWWYRKEFSIDEGYANTDIVFEGINYKANIWLNGQLIADAESIEHPFMIFDLNITKYLKKDNVLAVEIFPAAKDALTLGFVDWNPESPDRNMGLWRGVKLIQSGKISLKNVVVKSEIDKDKFEWAKLSIYTDVVNNSNEPISGVLNYEIDNIKISKEYNIGANATKTIIASSNDFKELTINNPKLWWPINMGEPNLYNLKAEAVVANSISFSKDIRFGIREVGDFINEAGHRGYTVNGKKVMIRGGGWVDDLLLSDSDEKVLAQVAYTKHMGLNTIRLEGFWGRNKTIYDACDENGILLMIGLSCQWEWIHYCGRKQYDDYMSVETPEDIEMISKAYKTQVEWMNNHPSIYVWVLGSDKLPFPKFETKLTKYINDADGTRPILTSCGWKESTISGPSAVKMVGPYEYVTPNYWYADTLGGAFGYNTETGPGPQIPPLESIEKMLSKEHQWPIDNDTWNYHLGRNQFQSIDEFMEAFDARYGKASSIEDLAFRAQIANYETMRAMFEAFALNKFDATGVIQWMLNSAWPEMYWQLYDWYLMPNGAFYGAKAACQSLNLVYNYKDKAIYLTNETLKEFKGKAEIKVLDINSNVLYDEIIEVEVGENTSNKALDFPSTNGLSESYFLVMNLKDEQGAVQSENFYWLSTKEDVQDYGKSSWYYTPMQSYADFTTLNKLPKAEVEANPVFIETGEMQKLDVNLKNNSDKLAFFIEMKVVGENSQQSVLPVFWSNNYVLLLPGEERVYTAEFATKNLNGEKPVFKMQYLNQN